jgi:hypothetical protein
MAQRVSIVPTDLGSVKTPLAPTEAPQTPPGAIVRLPESPYDTQDIDWLVPFTCRLPSSILTAMNRLVTDSKGKLDKTAIVKEALARYLRRLE